MPSGLNWDCGNAGPCFPPQSHVRRYPPLPARMHTRMHTHTHTHMNAHMRAHIRTHTHICVCTHARPSQAHTHMHTCVCTRTLAHMHTHTHVHVCALTQMHAHRCTHMHTRVRAHTKLCSNRSRGLCTFSSLFTFLTPCFPSMFSPRLRLPLNFLWEVFPDPEEKICVPHRLQDYTVTA